MGKPRRQLSAAFAMLLLGVVSLAAAEEVLHQTADILLFLLGMMVLT